MTADGAGMERSVWALSVRKVDLILEVKGSAWSDGVTPGCGKEESGLREAGRAAAS